ncbi:hypothetical protein D3C86_1298460 [compost metagenome]
MLEAVSPVTTWRLKPFLSIRVMAERLDWLVKKLPSMSPESRASPLAVSSPSAKTVSLPVPSSDSERRSWPDSVRMYRPVASTQVEVGEFTPKAICWLSWSELMR